MGAKKWRTVFARPHQRTERRGLGKDNDDDEREEEFKSKMGQDKSDAAGGKERKVKGGKSGDSYKNKESVRKKFSHCEG